MGNFAIHNSSGNILLERKSKEKEKATGAFIVQQFKKFDETQNAEKKHN
jgi:hypothetical protein